MATSTGHSASITLPGVTIAEVLDISWSGISKNSIETTNMATGAAASSSGGRTYIAASPSDAGEITIEANLDNNAATWISCIDAASGEIELTFPDDGTWTASGFVTAASFSVPLEDKMTASITLKLTGDIVVA
tara:strand:+ start:104 stop:502 length:399 start_codon:yes stop_codon:yes gene_type:complete